MSRYFQVLRRSHGQVGEPQTPLGEELKNIADKEPENVIETTDPPKIPIERVQIHPASRLVFDSDAMSPGADRFRFLRLRLRELWNSGHLRTLLITSPLSGDGKSTIALNLATTLAEQGQRSVLLIEADLHHPTLAQQLGIESGPGLAECLQNRLDPLSAVRRLEPLGWYLLPSGKTCAHPTELLLSEALADVMQELSPYFDWILLDSPPVIPLTDAVSLARQTDASLVVAWAGRTPREAIEQTVNLLGPKHVLGILLNGVQGLNRLYSKYYRYYNRYSSPTAGTEDKKNESIQPRPVPPKKSNNNSHRIVIRVPRTAFWRTAAFAWVVFVFCFSKLPFECYRRIIAVFVRHSAVDTKMPVSFELNLHFSKSQLSKND